MFVKLCNQFRLVKSVSGSEFTGAGSMEIDLLTSNMFYWKRKTLIIFSSTCLCCFFFFFFRIHPCLSIPRRFKKSLISPQGCVFAQGAIVEFPRDRFRPINNRLPGTCVQDIGAGSFSIFSPSVRAKGFVYLSVVGLLITWHTPIMVYILLLLLLCVVVKVPVVPKGRNDCIVSGAYY